jgi:hypothetical protein
MNSPKATERSTRQQFADAWMRVLSSNRFIFGYFGFSLLLFLMVGISFWVASVGLLLAFSTLAPVYDPAYQLFIRVFKITGLPPHAQRPSFWEIVNLLIQLAVALFFILLAVRIFQVLGFCSQNLTCLLATTLTAQ